MRTFIAAFLLAASVPAAADLGLAPATLDFGAQSMGTTSPSSAITVTNNGTAAATIASIDLGTGNFQLTHDCASLAAGASCTITVTFHPLPQAGGLNSTATIPDTLTVHADAPSAAASLQGLAEKSLVTHFYRAILRRAPDVPGKAYWDGEALRMQALGANLNETWYAMAAYFYASGEYASQGRDDAGFVEDLYRTFLDRDADAAGLSFWLGQISAGVPRGVVLAGFMFSTEFKTLSEGVFGVQNVAREIDLVMDMYRGFLGRLPDTPGFNDWLARIRDLPCGDGAGLDASMESMGGGFVASHEYSSKSRSDVGFVGDLYNAYLRRGGEADGVNYWLAQLALHSMTRTQVRQGFRQSTEFGQRVQAVVLPGCTMPSVVFGQGKKASLALGGDGLPIIAFIDPSGQLNLVHCQDVACMVRDAPRTITGATDVARDLRLAVAPDGLPLVLFTLGSANLFSDAFWTAKCADPGCTIVATAQVLASSYTVDGIDLALAPDGKAWVVHREQFCSVGCFASAALSKCADGACMVAGATPPSVLVAGYFFADAALSVPVDGLPLLFTRFKAKYDAHDSLRVMKCTDVQCSTGRVDSSVDLGAGEASSAVEVAMPSDDRAVLWYGTKAGQLWSSKCIDATCATRTPFAPIDRAIVATPSAAIVAGGAPALSFHDDATGSIHVARCTDAACATSTVGVLPRFAKSLRQPTLRAAADGKPMLVFDDGAGVLRFVKCAADDCTPP